jgi:hypothetical protein
VCIFIQDLDQRAHSVKIGLQARTRDLAAVFDMEYNVKNVGNMRFLFGGQALDVYKDYTLEG